MAEIVAKEEKKPNVIANFFKGLGLGIKNFFVNLGKNIKNGFINFGKRFADGSLGTKMSHFVFGAGSFYHHQWIKGSLYLLLEVGIILFMVLCPEVNGTPYGWRALGPEGLW